MAESKNSRVRALAEKVDRYPRSSVAIVAVVAFLLGGASGGPGTETVATSAAAPMTGSTSVDDLEQQLDSLTSELTRSDAQVETLNRGNNKLEKQVRTYQRQMQKLRGNLSTTRAALSQARSASQTVAAAPSTSSSSECDPNYTGSCVPIVSYDLNCDDISGSVTVVGYDKHGFDGDNDGSGCE